MQVDEIAETWRARGITPIPCRPQTKVAAIQWKHWQTELPSAELVREWFSDPARNLALVTGGTGGLVVLDFDDAAAFESWSTAYPEEAGTHTVKTNRGYHVYFRSPTPIAGRPDLDAGYEVKAQGGYVLAPPSIHPEGTRYTVWKDMPVRTLSAQMAEMLVTPAPLRLTFTATPTTECKLHSPDPEDPIGRIKQAFPILTLVSRYSDPTASSSDGRWFIARCPFPAYHAHGDANPSFWVNPELGICGCHTPTCRAQQPNGKPMDVINLYARMEGLSNNDAIQALEKEMDSCKLHVA